MGRSNYDSTLTAAPRGGRSSSSSTSSPLDKAAVRRQYKAQKQQYYREQAREEVTAMRKQIEELQAELVRLGQRTKSKSLLPWKEVAGALQDHSQEAVVRQHSLKTQRQKHVDLILCLNKWIRQANGMPTDSDISTLPSPTWGASNFSLSRISLVAQPDARRQGFDWLTQILYHNTDAVFQKYAFPTALPSSSRRLGDITLDSTNLDRINVITRYAIEFDGALEDVVALVKKHEIDLKSYTGVPPDVAATRGLTVTFEDTEALHSISPTLTYVCVRSNISSRAALILYRQYNDADRVVIVGQSIPSDEAHAIDFTCRKSLIWYVFDRLSPTKTLVRNLYVASHTVSAAGEFIPFEDETRRWGCDVSHIHEEAKVPVFNRFLMNMSSGAFVRTDAAMQSVMLNDVYPVPAVESPNSSTVLATEASFRRVFSGLASQSAVRMAVTRVASSVLDLGPWSLVVDRAAWGFAKGCVGGVANGRMLPDPHKDSTIRERPWETSASIPSTYIVVPIHASQHIVDFKRPPPPPPPGLNESFATASLASVLVRML
ncbi:Aste57867_8438 [Aphanomyces stellatus]|uniref:Aste57867_8438 protein n=1 Tax=Aphanomyces stellatus TaxID=120398 RepID=A0A485KKA0_9STRA|nr:hypothetical protein As57867_008406 [Aphanomyces stellatus]VFT85324.1 Aste57867_8438 [Aphanomyces stellatus]